MNFKDTKEVFDFYTNFIVDKKLLIKISTYLQKLINRDDETANFVGGHLCGVYRPTWSTAKDSASWLEDICGINDPEQCQSDVYDLSYLKSTWNVAPDITNISFLYVSYRIKTAKNINPKDAEEAIIQTIMIAHMKHAFGLQRKRWQHPANPATATAHFESLDYRSDLKKYGSWMGLFRNRGEQVVSPKFLWKRQLETFQGGEEVKNWTADLQDRLADVFNALATSFYDIHRQESKISSTSVVGEVDGIKVVKSVESTRLALIAKLRETFKNRRALIKDNILDGTKLLVSTADVRSLRETLNFIADNHRYYATELEDASEKLVVFLFELVRENDIPMGNVPVIAEKSRDVIRSSQVKKSDVVTLKHYCRSFTEEAIPRARQNVVAATTVAVFVYLILRIIVLSNE